MVATAKLNQIMLVLAMCLHLPCLQAGRFLQQEEVSATELEIKMLTDLASSYQRTDGSKRIEYFEDALRPIFVALPKDRHGALTHSVVRYALHRVFMQRNAWFIRGLDPNMESNQTPTSNISLALEGIPLLPSLLQGTLEHAHKNRGLNLRETAAFAAAIDDLIYRDARNRLSMAYSVLSLGEDKVLTTEESQLVVGTYMTIYMLGSNLSNWTKEEIQRKELRYFNSKRWRKVYAWVQGVRADVPVNGSSYSGLEKIVEALGEQFGNFNGEDCRGMKNTLMRMEGRAPGRVRLSDFYNKSRYSVWGFREKIEYLRALGALDESNFSNPQVIIPNYVASMPQCLKASAVYSVCCRVECEDLISRIERKVAAPDVDADQLVGIVEQLSSDTQAPRKLSSSLVNRLREVADHHGGLVPIHGRLFAQWMHHTFPRECPYPHKAGSTNPQTPDEWMKESGQSDSQASEEEMLQHIRPDDTCPIEGCEDGVEADIPWSFTEELLVSPDITPTRARRVVLHHLMHSVLPSEHQMLFYFFAFVAIFFLHRDNLVKNKLIKIRGDNDLK